MQQLPSVSPNSPQSGFTPRKEFIREQRPPPNSFAVLAIASSNFIRLYSFPLQVVTSLRHILEQHSILTGFRENVSQSLYEFTLEGKPWASAKSVATEKLIIDLVAVVYQCGYTYLSTLDYGREYDDRLVMAFSKPDTHASLRSGTPSQSSEKSVRSKRIPFALSFTSGTTMRVIAPPLNLTPAILQAVRNAWPRGVVSEKKVGENSFEFKLKGYKWFQQDTFPTDSLSHILSLLSSLDAQSYTLLSSISLTNHSRVKDLWIFMGPPLPEDSSNQDSPASSILDSAQSEVGRQVRSPDLLARSQLPVYPNSPSHRKFATEPDTSYLSHHHPRAATINAGQDTEPRQRNDPHVIGTPSPLPSGTLRKVPPKSSPRAAQVAPPLDQKAEKPYNGRVRAALPSTISTDVENMTGVGSGAGIFSPNVFYPPSPYDGTDKSISSDRPPSPQRPPRSKSVTPPHHQYPLLVSNSSPSSSPPQSVPIAQPEQEGDAIDSVIPSLLGAGAFRDSAFSSSSQATFYIPIKGQDDYAERDQESAGSPKPSLDHRSPSAGLALAGGWHPSPVKEEDEIDLGLNGDVSAIDGQDAGDGDKTPIYEVGSRVSSPELTRPDSKLRKSEAAVVGVISEPVPSPPPMPRRSQDKRKDAGTGQGWVLVNVDGMSPSSPVENTRDTHGASRSLSPALANRNGPDKVDVPRSPEARPIVVIDEKNNGKKSRSTDESPPPKKSFFGLGRKSSRGRKAQSLPVNSPAMKEEKEAGASKHWPLRDKLRLISTPETPRKDSKRRSIE